MIVELSVGCFLISAPPRALSPLAASCFLPGKASLIYLFYPEFTLDSTPSTVREGPTDTMSFANEDQKYLEEVQAVKAWWQDSRWRYTKRPFTAEQIVAKRGNLKIDYPSNVQSKKLWGIVENNFKVRRLL